ncbi:MAG: undecaprenyl/decaprenyl-phosphate alpha-N-acetylglucosaminyl 1-phosphate transferase [Bifidobacteriaceae bacterium]|jgi:UDP-GlcNAc:undecaprenyl-phosphate GlcNAc-1-phosphate transferase|nr:undecaprenyl/decaprenyl-phosphate alpha-N-acetylglucosaminyl 1-phosphate transferase [Bifidobacteriaceae bacterium]
MKIYFLLTIISGVITFLVTPLIRLLAIRVGAVTNVRQRDVHKVPTPRLGGLAMLIGFIITFLIANWFQFLKPVFETQKQLFPMLLGAIGICLLGAADDKWDLDWLLKLSGQIGICILVAINGVQLLSIPIMGQTVSSQNSLIVFTVLAIVAVMNAVNFVDGLDGLAAGIVAISASAFWLFSYTLTFNMTSYASASSLISALLVGACLGFLPHNFRSKKIFMGDSGSMLLGYLMACSTIIVTGNIEADSSLIDSLPAFMPMILPFLVLIIPLIDMALAIIRRLLKKQSPFAPDRMHLHHRMLEIGHTQITAILILYLWTALFAYGSSLTLFFPVKVVIPVVVVCAGVLLGITVIPHIAKVIREDNF